MSNSKSLKLSGAAFCKDFDDTMAKFGVPDAEKNELFAIVQSTKGDVGPQGNSALRRIAMFRNIAFAAIYVAVLVFLTAALARSADYGTAEEARATLDKAVAAVKADKAKALDMFNKGEGGFKDRDLYVFCANASDGVITAHPTHKGEQLADIKGKKGFPLGQEMMKNATEGKVSEVTYWWPRPGSDKPLEKTSFYTKVGDQICGVGYYK